VLKIEDPEPGKGEQTEKSQQLIAPFHFIPVAAVCDRRKYQRMQIKYCSAYWGRDARV
jgi:hypothetical protein